MKFDVIVIGAGASGLMAARALAVAGLHVLVLDAKEIPGGRIHTFHDKLFPVPVEGGAEFVHGELPVTMKLAKEAGLSMIETSGKLYNARKGHLHKQNDFIEHNGTFIKKLEDLIEDLSVSDFLHKYFPDSKYNALRLSVKGYVEGYALADMKKASTFALRKEWLEEDNSNQFRIKGGYGTIVNFLYEQSLSNGCLYKFSSEAQAINWKKDDVTVQTKDKSAYKGRKVIITVPLGVLKSGSIVFNPAIALKENAIRKLEYGTVIKSALLFDEMFWENENIVNGKMMPGLGFLFADTLIPTWWTQLPNKIPMLTAWFGGPEAMKKSKETDEMILQYAMDSLSSIFNIPHAVLIEKLVAWKIFNWMKDPFSRGGYSYAALEGEANRKILQEPVEETVFFSGEALYKTTEIGLVEAALATGSITAGKILQLMHAEK